MEAFLQSVAKYIYGHFHDRLHEVAVIFPNKRARLFFNSYIADLTDKPVFAPGYFTISELMQKLANTVPADSITLLFELYQVYARKVQNPQSFDAFLYYCETILADFDDIEKYNVDAKSLFTVIAETKDIDYLLEYLNDNQKEALRQFWGTFNTDPLSDEQVSFKEFWEVLWAINQEFLQVLHENSMAFEGMIFKKAVTDFKEGRANLPYHKVAFIGFNALNYFERELFGLLHQTQRGMFFWDYDPSYLAPDVASYHQAAFFLKEYVTKYPAPTDFTFESNLTGSKKFKKIALPTLAGQAKSLPTVLSDYLREENHSVNDMLICLADESLLPQVIKALPADIGPVNVSLGYPLKDTLSYSFLEQLVQLYSNSRSKDRKLLFHHRDVLRLTNNGLLNNTIRNEFQKLRDTIHAKNLLWIEVASDSFRSTLPIRIFGFEKTASGFISHLMELVKDIIQLEYANATETFNIEREALVLIHQQLMRFNEVIAKAPIELSLQVQAQLLKRHIETLSLAFKGEPLQGVQLMGMLETRTIDFRQIVFISMNEGVYPKVSNIPSLIPYTLRKGFGLPTPEHRDAIFAYYFYRLMHRAQKATFMYSTSEGGMSKGEPSRFIQQLQFQYRFPMEHQQRVYRVKSSASNLLNVPFNQKARDYVKALLVADNKPLSPSAINTYLSCPLKFYFSYVEKVRTVTQVQEEVSPSQFGNIVHHAMQTLYGRFKDELISAELLNMLVSDSTSIRSAVEKAMVQEYKREEADVSIDFKGNLLITREVVQRYIHLILSADIKIAPLQILSLEKSHKTLMDLPGVYPPINIGGFIDRMDSIDGITRIIDYKTGQPKSSYGSLDELFNHPPSKRNDAVLQTFIYCAVVHRLQPSAKVQPGLYYLRNMASNTFDARIEQGTRNKKLVIDDYTLVRDEFENLLGDYLKPLLMDEAVFCQTDDLEYCKYCDYAGICNREI